MGTGAWEKNQLRLGSVTRYVVCLHKNRVVNLKPIWMITYLREVEPKPVLSCLVDE